MSGQKSFRETFTATSKTDFDQDYWNRFVGDVDVRIKALETLSISWDVVMQQGVGVVLARINEVLLPAGERIRELTELGFLIAYSTSAVELVEGEGAAFEITAGAQADLFTPSEFLCITRSGSVTDYAVARLVGYDKETRQLAVNIVTVFGDPGPHDAWEIAAVAGSVMAAVEAMATAVVAKDLAKAWAEKADNADVDGAGTRSSKHWAGRASASAATAEGSASDAAGSAAAASGFAAVASTALTSFGGVYLGERSADPVAGSAGQIYFDTVAQVLKVYGPTTGWAPAVSAALGGVKRADYRQAFGNLSAGQTAFLVGGGFTALDVFKNGALLVEGVDVTFASPNFTLASAVIATDKIAARGYAASDGSEFFTKTEANSRFALKAHGHAIADVAGLAAALSGKSATGHEHHAADVVDLGDMAQRNISDLSNNTGVNVSTLFPATECVVAVCNENKTRGTAVVLRISNDSGQEFREGGGGSPLPGTWRQRGRVAEQTYLFRRVI